MFTESSKSPPYFLRDLPLPAKVVITCFLLAVGCGYAAAMVQLHMQDSKSGKMLPMFDDVILKFTGKKWFRENPPRPVSKLEKLVMGPIDTQTFSGSNMAPVFYQKDGGEFNKLIKKAPDDRPRIEAERNGEREAIALWINSPADVRKKAYEEDKFSVEPGKAPKAITKDFTDPDSHVIHIKTIFRDRCVRCHSKDSSDLQAMKYQLENFSQISEYLDSAPEVTVKEGGDWVKIEEPIGIEKLTQSTHAHLLSFAMLFSLTGLVFAFSSYPTVVRCIIGPWVLLAIVGDVSLWWLARLCKEWGPYFAMAVIFSGGAAGAGLAAQIVLSLFNMYGIKGKIVILLLFLAGGGCGALVYLNQIQPGLEKKREKLNGHAGTENTTQETKPAPQPNPAQENTNTQPKKQDNVIPNVAVSPMEQVFRLPVKDSEGKELPLLKIPFKGVLEDGKTIQEGGMIRAFFDKDGEDFAKAVKTSDMKTQENLKPQRLGEMEALLAWMKLSDVERRKSYETDVFDLPSALVGKPITDVYIAGNKLKVKTLLGDRCVRCHASGSDAEKYPLENYDQLFKLLSPQK